VHQERILAMTLHDEKSVTSLLVLFDGVCVLCDRSVRLLLRIDRKELFKFAALQGQTAADLLARHPEIDPRNRSIIFVRNYGAGQEAIYLRSSAILEILSELGGLWKLAVLCKIIPAAFRDMVYDFIAGQRYRWFGKQDQCRVPGTEVRDRFLP